MYKDEIQSYFKKAKIRGRTPWFITFAVIFGIAFIAYFLTFFIGEIYLMNDIRVIIAYSVLIIVFFYLFMVFSTYMTITIKNRFKTKFVLGLHLFILFNYSKLKVLRKSEINKNKPLDISINNAKELIELAEVK